MSYQAVQAAVEFFDRSATRMAQAIGMGVKRQNVEYWLAAGKVPVEFCAAVDRATGGVVRRWHLRPNDWFCIWPELVGTEGAPDPVAPQLEVSHAG
jgi:DNA-binding transcriptional regulator YdaS (Cro superfamily)